MFRTFCQELFGLRPLVYFLAEFSIGFQKLLRAFLDTQIKRLVRTLDRRTLCCKTSTIERKVRDNISMWVTRLYGQAIARCRRSLPEQCV